MPMDIGRKRGNRLPQRLRSFGAIGPDRPVRRRARHAQKRDFVRHGLRSVAAWQPEKGLNIISSKERGEIWRIGHSSHARPPVWHCTWRCIRPAPKDAAQRKGPPGGDPFLSQLDGVALNVRLRRSSAASNQVSFAAPASHSQHPAGPDACHGFAVQLLLNLLTSCRPCRPCRPCQACRHRLRRLWLACLRPWLLL